MASLPSMCPEWLRRGGGTAALALAAMVLCADVRAETKVRAEDDRIAREAELESIRLEQRRNAEAEAALRAEIAALGEDRRKLSGALVDSAERLRNLEERSAETEERLSGLIEEEDRLRLRLQGRRGVLVELLAALQRMGRQPPPALLARPEEALQSVRAAILLNAVLPGMRAEAEELAQQIAALVKIRREIAAERESLHRDLADASKERSRVAMLIEERQKRQSEAERALEGARARAATLARQAETLKELLAKLAPERAPPSTPGGQAARLSPAVPFASARRALPLPVQGVKIRQFGTSDGFGGTEKGLSIATRAGASVIAPADGWVIYSGPFRSYGQLLILNAGDGYHIVLAGMERISVQLGQFVLKGEPIATMGSGPKTASALPVGASQPTLYIEFRKDGTPVDPAPWWATDSRKVRG